MNDNYSTTNCRSYTNKKFFDYFGSIINSGLILIPNLSDILDDLGHNILPKGLIGEPDDILEFYVCELLQFLFMSPTRRYGKDRLFQKLPDGVVLGKQFMILIDSKAYSSGFEFSADDIERFAFYVDDFNYRYSDYFGRVFTFLVVSGKFNDSLNSISKRSDELYKKCGCKLSCITSEKLGTIVTLLRSTPNNRSSIDWRNILSKLVVEIKDVENEVRRIQKDKIH